MRLVWITRSEPGASRTAENVRRLGFEPLIDPVLAVEPIEVEPDLRGAAAIAITSANGASRLSRLNAEKTLPVFAVGDATANAARDAGFTNVASAAGDVETLVRMIASARPPGAVVHICGEDHAGDLVGGLRVADLEARRAIVYRTVAASRISEPTKRSIERRRLYAVLVHSPKAGETLHRLLSVTPAPTDAIRLLGLSQACLAALRMLRWRSQAAASRPNEVELLGLLEGP